MARVLAFVSFEEGRSGRGGCAMSVVRMYTWKHVFLYTEEEEEEEEATKKESFYLNNLFGSYPLIQVGRLPRKERSSSSSTQTKTECTCVQIRVRLRYDCNTKLVSVGETWPLNPDIKQFFTFLFFLPPTTTSKRKLRIKSQWEGKEKRNKQKEERRATLTLIAAQPTLMEKTARYGVALHSPVRVDEGSWKTGMVWTVNSCEPSRRTDEQKTAADSN